VDSCSVYRSCIVEYHLIDHVISIACCDLIESHYHVQLVRFCRHVQYYSWCISRQQLVLLYSVSFACLNQTINQANLIELLIDICEVI